MCTISASIVCGETGSICIDIPQSTPVDIFPDYLSGHGCRDPHNLSQDGGSILEHDSEGFSFSQKLHQYRRRIHHQCLLMSAWNLPEFPTEIWSGELRVHGTDSTENILYERWFKKKFTHCISFLHMSVVGRVRHRSDPGLKSTVLLSSCSMIIISTYGILLLIIHSLNIEWKYCHFRN